MAKGIPLMGRDPDGKAKMINVDENGNVKVQQSGTIKRYAPYPSGLSYANLITGSYFERFLALSRDKTKLLGRQGASLVQSTDGWKTRTLIKSFPNPSNYVDAVRELDNGELLVSTWYTEVVPNVMTTIWHGVENEGVWTWENVLEGSPGAHFTNHWGLSVHGCMALASEYGPHGVATRVYLSNDYGRKDSWIEVLDLLGPKMPVSINPDVTHVHAGAIDSFSGDLWVTYGDGASNCGLLRSRDYGDTWESVFVDIQMTNVYPLRDYVILGSDDGSRAQGVYRLNKKTYKLELAYEIAAPIAQSGKRYCSIFNYRNNEPNAPLYITFLLESGSGRMHVIGTINGVDFYPIINDSRKRTGPQAIDVFLGPDSNGNIYLCDRTFDGWTTLKAPIWTEI